MKFLLVLLCGLLGACDAPRPYGSWEPKYPDAGPDESMSNGDFGDDTNDATGTDEDDPAGQTDDQSKPAGGSKDGGVKPSMDAGKPVTVPVDSKGPFGRLPGKYLMRMDSYTTVDATQGSNRLHVENRVSNLLFVTLTVNDEGKLIGEEKLCDQTYTHVCGVGCEEWTTTLDTALVKSFFPNVKVQREYQLDGETLTATPATMLLGFDGDDPSPATPLPKATSDSNIWKLDPASNTSPNPNRVGLRTQIMASLKTSGAFPVKADFACTVVTVQSLTSSFKIGGVAPLDSEALTKVYRAIETDESHIDTIFAQAGANSSTLTRDLCTTAKFREQTANNELNALIMKRADELSGCPLTADFEKLLPGAATRPSLK